MLAESNRPPASPDLPTQNPVLGADSSYRTRATATDRMLQVLQRRKWAIATTALAAASGIWAWTLTRPYVYQGQVQVLAEATAGSDSLEPALLESAAVLEPAADSLQTEYPNITYQRLSENLSVMPQDGGSLAIRYLGASPAEVEAVLRQVAQQYQDVSQESLTFTLPTVSDRPVSPKILQGLLLGAIAGVSLGAIAGLLTEKLDRSFHSPDSLKTFTKLPMLGIIPFFKTLQPIKPGRLVPPQSPLLTGLADYETASFSEAFRTLYSNLRFLKTDRPVRSLVISSAIPAEGKSTTALNLAKAAAVMGQRVLLVDADLRLPQIHTRLQLPNRTGLSEILGQRLSWRSHVRTALDENLQILTAGNPPADPVRLLSSATMRELMHELSEAFDLVIYDMPPLLGFTDSGLVAAQTDGMVLVVGLGTTTRIELKQTLDSLEVMPVQVLGMVANGIRSHTTQSYSYDRYHRYYAQRAMVTAAEAQLGMAAPSLATLSTDLLDEPSDRPAEDTLDRSALDEAATLESVEAQPLEFEDLESADSTDLVDDEPASILSTELIAEHDAESAPLPISDLATPAPSSALADEVDFTSEQTVAEAVTEAGVPEPEIVADSPSEQVSTADDSAQNTEDTALSNTISQEPESATEATEPQPTLFSQMMSEMKTLVQVYSDLPRLLQQATHTRQDKAENAGTVEAGQGNPDALLAQEDSGSPLDDSILDEETVDAIELEAIAASDELERPDDFRTSGLALEEDMGDRPSDPLEEVAADAIDPYMGAQPPEQQSFGQNGFDLDQNMEAIDENPVEEPRPRSTNTDSLAWLDSELDGPEDDLLDEPPGAAWPGLDAFLTDKDDSDDEFADEDTAPQTTDSGLQDALDAFAVQASDAGSEPQDLTTMGDRPTLSSHPTPATQADDPSNVGLSDDELAHLQEYGLLSSLALPDESLLEDGNEESSEPSTAPSSEFASLFDETDDLMADEDTLILIPDGNSMDAIFNDSLETPETSDSALDSPTDEPLDSFLSELNGRSPAPFSDASSSLNTVPYEDPEDVLIDSLRDLKDEDWDIEDEFSGDHVTELEEQELKELLSWDMLTIDQTVSNQFERAVLAAQDAIRIGETVTTPEDWLLLSTQWQQASDLMAAVPEDDPNFEIAQRCQALYKNNSEFAYQKARHAAESDH